MQILFDIVVMLIILGVLISIHEAGHLSMAKLFKVYCFEYSLGFGPKLLHVKKKNGETYFSIRALPVGGYVSMYGEEGAVPEGVTTPPEGRSLEGVAKWKKAIILLAGVVLNYLLGLILIFLSVSCFDQYYYGQGIRFSSDDGTTSLIAAYTPATYAENSAAYNEIAVKKDPVLAVNDYVLFDGTNAYPALDSQSQYGTIIDSDVTLFDKNDNPYKIDGSVMTYVAVYAPSTLTSAHSLSGNLQLYPASSINPNDVSPLYTKIGVTHFPDTEKGFFQPKALADGSYSFNLTVTLMPLKSGSVEGSPWDRKIYITPHLEVANGAWSDPGISISVFSSRNSWSEAWREWAYYVPESNIAIVKGIFSLFTPTGFNNLSGIVNMTVAVGTYSAMGGAASVFLYAGLISINLAIFNLLPFPGLDGWQLLVTIIEGSVDSIKKNKYQAAAKNTSATESLAPYKPWKIPSKVKAIVSYIGLALLMILMLGIMVKEVIGLF